MKILGLEIKKSSEINKLFSEFSEIKKKLQEYQKLRPEDKLIKTSQKDDGARIPMYPIPENYLYGLALNSDIVRIALNTLSMGIFRRGIEIKEKEDIKPNKQEKEVLENLLEVANENNQNLLDVLKQLEEDVNILDKIYLIAVKKYYFNNQGEIVDKFTEIKEFIRADPLSMKVIADRENRLGYLENGQKVYISLDDRETLITEQQAKRQNYLSKTGKKLYPACYVATFKDNKKIYYLKDEVLYLTKSSNFWGYSKSFAVWQKIVTLNEMDRFLRLAYQKQRSPRGLLTIATSNYESLRKAWEELKAEVRKDPYSINPLLYENPDGKTGVQFIDFMKPLNEMQYIETRNEMRRLILAIYGVTPVFSGDVQMSGGLNNESQQIYGVTNKALEDGQSFYNNKVLKWILKQLKIETYDLVLRTPEEENEVENLKMVKLRIENAQMMSNMGFDVEWLPEEKDFKFSNKPTKQTEQFFPLKEAPEELKKNFEIVKKQIQDKKLDKQIYEYIQKEREKLIKEGLEFEINKKIDQQFVNYIKASLFSKMYSDLGKSVSMDINNILLTGIIAGSSVETLISQIKDLGVEENQAEIIVNTEQQALQNKVREYNYKNAKGSENFKYQWIGPDDQRTTQICKNIKRRTKNGVSLEKLKQIIKEESIKGGFDGSRELTPHINCYSEDTEVLTINGFKLIKDVKIGDKVLSLNPKTKNIEEAKVINKIIKKSDYINILKSNTFNVKVDDEHPHFAYKRISNNKLKPVKVKTRDLKGNIKFYASSNWKGKDKKYIKINNKRFKTEDFMRFLGYYLSEGNLRKKRGYSIKISQEKYLDEMYDDLKDIGLDKVIKYKNYIYIRDKDVYNWIKENCDEKSYNKFIPKEIKELDKKYLRILLDAYLLGDGSKVKPKPWKNINFNEKNIYFTSSKKLMSDLVELIIKVGKSVSVSLRKPKLTIFKNGIYKSKHVLYIIYELNGRYKDFRYIKVKRKKYGKLVYDLTLNKNHTLLIKTDGKIHWNSNCRHTFIRKL